MTLGNLVATRGEQRHRCNLEKCIYNMRTPGPTSHYASKSLGLLGNKKEEEDLMERIVCGLEVDDKSAGWTTGGDKSKLRTMEQTLGLDGYTFNTDTAIHAHYIGNFCRTGEEETSKLAV